MKKILLLDDDKNNLEIISFILTEFGYEVSTRCSGNTIFEDIKAYLGIPLKLIRRSAATWKCVPPLIDQGVPGGLTRYSGAN